MKFSAKNTAIAAFSTILLASSFYPTAGVLTTAPATPMTRILPTQRVKFAARLMAPTVPIPTPTVVS